ncbi:hypothetical protein CVT24_002456 [Panaeolus cyanescens]|uniref:Protein kinase domain-containing protein n=1 Tax=Panaeolus cyanescens TaxID=181874 RepID=A0A409YZA3_9AGAR|nr:hypothetical protein CVT24_002456 [Panaeolus cyanescens]
MTSIVQEWVESLALPDSLFKTYFQAILAAQKRKKYLLREAMKLGFLPEMMTSGPPLRLQDRHLAEELLPNQIIYAPTLLEDMRKEFCVQFEQFITLHGTPKRGRSIFPETILRGIVVDAPVSVYQGYISSIGKASLQYASRMHVMPSVNEWPLAFRIYTKDYAQPFVFEAHVGVSPGPPASHTSAFGMEFINPEVRDQLESLRGKDIELGALTFYPPTPDGEFILDKLDGSDFKWTIAHTDGYFSPENTSKYAQSRDWKHAFWNKYVLPQTKPSKPSANMRRKKEKKNVWIPNTSGSRASNYKPNINHFIQRAWTVAVEKDCTFILISCGTKERIGIRHRATNTLLLSDIIDPFGEMYGITHLAFFSAMVRDILNREVLTSPSALTVPDCLPSHRDPDPELLDKELARRPVILLSFNIGVFRSPSPSAFLRKGPSCAPLPFSPSFQEQKSGRKCHINNSIALELTELVGIGAQGLIYRAVARLPSDTDSTLEAQVIVKVGQSILDYADIKKEYKAYRTLAENNVSEGILKVYGLFEDPETGMLLIVMQDGGKCFVDGRTKLLTDSQFKILSRAIQAINAAGILHNDVKCNNLLLDAQGNPYIIDFGLAEFTSQFYVEDSVGDVEGSYPGNATAHALQVVEEEAAKAKIRSYDLQSIEDIYLGWHYPNRRYPRC